MPELDLYDKQEAIFSERRPEIRNLIFCGGIQCGKTTIGGAWCTHAAYEIGEQWNWKNCEDTGIIAAPTYKILQQATLPKFLAMNSQFGRYSKQDNIFTYHWGFKVYMRTATRPESMEGISNVRFAWGDEGGLFPLYFHENLMGRVARLQGPILYTTTPYAMNWMASLAKETMAGRRGDTLLVQARSVDSPYFPKAEYDRQRKLLDPRRFAMKYEGEFGKMQGLVYPEMPFILSRQLPQGTKFFCGIDWGHTDPFVLVVRAVTPEGVHFRVDEYYKTGLIASEIIQIVKARHALYGFTRGWADPSRPEYIEELSRNGIPVVAGNNDIRLGIDKQTELIRTQRFFVFEDMCPHGKDEYETYHYPEPEERGFDDDEKEQDPVDANNHGCDADRYCTVGILSGYAGPRITPSLPSRRDAISNDQRARIEQLKKNHVNRQY